MKPDFYSFEFACCHHYFDGDVVLEGIMIQALVYLADEENR